MNKNFITRIIDSKRPFYIKNPFLSGIIKIALILDILFISFIILRYKYISLELLIGLFLGLIWVNVGPYLIWFYNTKLMKNFFDRASILIDNRHELNEIAIKYYNFFAKKFWILTIPLIIIIPFIWIFSMPILSNYGFFGYTDPWYWFSFIGVVWVTILGGIGFNGVLTTLLTINNIAKKNIRIDPLHPDKIGGLSSIRYFTLGTTLLFSTGSLFLLAGFQIISFLEFLTPFVYFITFLYSFLILLSFLYPIIRINRKSEKVRSVILEKLRIKYYRINTLINRNQKKDKFSYDELNRVRIMYEDFRKVKLYPLEIETILKVLLAVVFPILLLYLGEHGFQFW